MKGNIRILFSIALALVVLDAAAEERKELRMREFDPIDVGAEVHGSGWESLAGRFVRLEDSAAGLVRKPVWDLSRNSAGLSLVFRSNTRRLELSFDVFGWKGMNHMPATGVSGVDLFAYQEMEEEQYSLFCQQVRSEEERGSLSYWSVLFKATSIADLLNRLEFVNEVAEYDRNLIEAIRQTRENIKADKAAMEEQEELLSQQQDELQKQVDDAAALIAEYAATQQGYEALAAAEEKEAKEIEAQIKKLLATSDVKPSLGSRC